MNEEGYLKSRVGQRNPFRVPDGYFGDFTSQMMDKLPCREARVVPIRNSRMKKLRPLLYVAACICVAIFSLALYFTEMPSATDAQDCEEAMAQGRTTSYWTYEDEVIDYAMMDNTDIYAYLSGE